MKGGDVAMIAALRALNATGALDGAQIIVVMTGDEESAGSPLELARGISSTRRSAATSRSRSRADARRVRPSPAVARAAGRSTVTARQGHSAGVFTSGYGAVYEMARILDTFRRELAGDPTLTFNPGLVAGGTTVQRDSIRHGARRRGQDQHHLSHHDRAGRSPLPARIAEGLRRGRACARSSRSTCRAPAPRSPSATAIPRCRRRRPGSSCLAQFDAVSRALGYGPVQGRPPGEPRCR